MEQKTLNAILVTKDRKEFITAMNDGTPPTERQMRNFTYFIYSEVIGTHTRFVPEKVFWDVYIITSRRSHFLIVERRP